MTKSQVRQQMWFGLVLWLALGAGLGYFLFETYQARVDWPVAFSHPDDFVPVSAYPVDAEVTWDWSQFGGELRRSNLETRYAVWLTVVYDVDGQSRQGRVKYASRMSLCGAQRNAQWAMAEGNAPVDLLMNVTDPSILTSSTYQAGRTSDVVSRLVIMGLVSVAWLVSPFYMRRKLAELTVESDAEVDAAEAMPLPR